MISNEWIVESGAAFHITSDITLLHDFKLLETPKIQLRDADGMRVMVLGHGRVRTEQLDIPDVRYVPDAIFHIISLRQLASNHATVIGMSTVDVIDKRTEQRVGWGHRRDDDGLYVLDHLVISQDGDASLPKETGGEDKKWILDSSSRIHYAFNLRLLHGLSTNDLQAIADALPPEGSEGRPWPEGSDDDLGRPVGSGHLHILGRGLVRNERFRVPDVCYIQGETRNVISATELARAHGLKLVFQRSWCLVWDPIKRKEVGRARFRNGVYVLDYLVIGQDDHESDETEPAAHNHALQNLELKLVESTVSEALTDATSRLEFEKEAARPAERDRFGLSRCDRMPSEDALAIRVGDAYYAYASKQHKNRDVYILDFVASHHMTADKALLKFEYMGKDDPRFPKGKVKDVEVAIGKFSPLCGVGSMDTGDINLQDVLHVEELAGNLVSTRQLLDQLATQLQERLWNSEVTRQHEANGEPAEKHDAIHDVARKLQGLGVPLLVVEELTRHIRSLRVNSTQIVGFARRIDDDRAPQQWISDLQKMNVPQVLIDELARQLRTNNETKSRPRINMLARRICKPEVVLAQGSFSVTVGKIEVGHGIRKDGLYHLTKLRCCPTVQLMVESDRWVLTETQAGDQ